MTSILKGVKHLHDNNYVHRDIKPQNIVFEDSNDIALCKLIDFGLCAKCTPKQRNGVGGTLLYQAPEQIFAMGNLAKASDIFTCGFIMF